MIALAGHPRPLSQGSPPAGSSRLDFTAVETETGNAFFFCGLNAWLCLFAFSICYAVALKSEAGWILLVVCSESFKGTLTKHPRYTMIFARESFPLSAKTKARLLSTALVANVQILSLAIGKELTFQSLQLWQWDRPEEVRISNQKVWFTHWELGPRILTLRTMNIKELVKQNSGTSIHLDGKKWYLYFCWYLRFSIPLHWV